MRVAVVSFTRRGALLARRIGEALDGAALYTVDRWAEELCQQPIGGLQRWTGEWFHRAEGLIFVSAAGIAVRAIAPHVRDKYTDPAVVSVDEGGQFVVPLLSGHVGGANELARQVACITGGTAVISTATDVNGLFAVDVWAQEQGLTIRDRETAKQVSASLLEGEAVGFSTDFPVTGSLPTGLTRGPGQTLGVWVTVGEGEPPYPRTLRLVPRVLAVGIGCKRDLPPERAEQAVTAVLRAWELDRRAVRLLASIDLKAEDAGIRALAERWEVPAVFYGAEELRRAPGTFTSSAFVTQVTGVDNVCERAAVLAAEGGDLLVRKQSRNGVTVAVALCPVELTF